jgi:hypothetical protein
MPFAAALCLGLLAPPVVAADFADGDMELTDRGPWNVYGTPVAVEKSTFAHGGVRSLRVVTDNQETMGGNYEGTSRGLGEFQPGDVLRVSFWYYVQGSKSIVVGMGRTSFEGRWVLSGTDWTQADVSLRCAHAGHYNIWMSQGGDATEFFLDDFALNVVQRADLGTVAEAQQAQLVGGPLRLTLCRQTGALAGIENLATGEVYAPVGQRQPLFSLELLSADGRAFEKVAFDEAKLSDLQLSDDEARADFEVGELGARVTANVALAPDGAAHFTATVRNDSNRTITAFELPVVFGVCPAADPKALTLVDPYTCARIVRDALSSSGCQATHPGRACMGWLDLSGEQGGIYLATHDPSATGTRLMALPAPGPSFDASLTKEIVVKPGETWECPEAVLAVHEGDWHASADRYREWARSWMKPPDLPEWIRRADGWVLMGVQNGIPFWRIPDIYRAAEWMGIDYLHVQGEGIDNMWFDEEGNRHSHALSYLYPSPRFGTPDDLKAAVRTIHDRGGHVMFYFLYERWTPSHSISDNFGTGTRADVPAPYLPPGLDFYYDNALVERPGTEPPTEHPFMAHRIMCLGSPGWQEWMRHWAIDVYAKEYGADGFYWDVMGRNGPFRCFNERHGHAGQNEWAAGSAKVLETVTREGRAINPDYAAAIEGCSDILGEWNGFHLMSGGTRNPNVFRYTFPEYLCVDGFSNTSWELTHPQKARRVLLDGERFDIHGYDQRVKKLINLRKRIKPFIDWPAVFKDTIGLTVSDDRIQARAFWRHDGRNSAIAVTMMNEEAVEGATVEVDCTPIGRPITAHVFRLDGSVDRVTNVGAETQAIPVPTDAVSAAVIVNNVAPELAVVPWVEQIMTPGTDGWVVAYFMPLRAVSEVTCRIRNAPVPDTERWRDPTDFGLVARTEYRDPAHLSALKRWEKLVVDFEWDGGSKAQLWTILAPPLVNGGFEEVEEGRLVYWGAPPCTEDPGQGERCIRLDPEIAPQKHISSLTPVKPDCRYRFKCMVKRMGEQWAGAHVVEYLEGSEFERSAVLNSTKRGEWETLETEFTTHPNPRSSAIYLYNFDDEPAYFDGLELEEVR